LILTPPGAAPWSTIEARRGHPTRVVVEYLASVEGEVGAAEVEHHGAPRQDAARAMLAALEQAAAHLEQAAAILVSADRPAAAASATEDAREARAAIARVVVPAPAPEPIRKR